MALEMKVRCMQCERPLAPGGDAFICSFECTFCVDCTAKLAQICPNCEGELSAASAQKSASHYVN